MRASCFASALLVAASVAAATLARADTGGPAPNAAARRAAAARAAAEIRATHFFTEGRGVHSLPGLADFGRRLPRFLYAAGRDAIARAAGFVVDGDEIVGTHDVTFDGATVLVTGCAVCHAGRAAGRTIVGLGNKTIDVGMLGFRQLTLAPAWRAWAASQPSDVRDVGESAIETAALLSDPARRNLTRGMVPVALVWSWFWRQAGTPSPDRARGAVKVPHLWGYAEKRRAGLFCDGLGDGKEPGWGVMTEATAGQTAETIRAYLPRVEEIERRFEDLLPPPYPYEADRALAARGARVFADRCAGCHGEYPRDADGLPEFRPPRHVPIDVVGTDRDRLDSVSPAFRRVVATSPLADVVRLGGLPEGFFAPRLDGIWARFPYLHNGSVPNLRAMLTPPEARPRVWSVADAGEESRFDPVAVGLTVPDPDGIEILSLERAARFGSRDVYWVAREGHSNQGHPFGTDLPEADKTTLVAYLKTL